MSQDKKLNALERMKLHAETMKATRQIERTKLEISARGSIMASLESGKELPTPLNRHEIKEYSGSHLQGFYVHEFHEAMLKVKENLENLDKLVEDEYALLSMECNTRKMIKEFESELNFETNEVIVDSLKEQIHLLKNGLMEAESKKEDFNRLEPQYRDTFNRSIDRASFFAAKLMEENWLTGNDIEKMQYIVRRSKEHLDRIGQ